MERDLTQYCAVRNLTKSQVVQETLAEYLVAAQTPSPSKPAPVPDLSFLAPTTQAILDPARPWFKSLSRGFGVGFQRTGAETKQFVWHANAHDTGGQDDNAQPRPRAKHASSRQDDQRQTSHDAKSTVNTAHVLSHDVS